MKVSLRKIVKRFDANTVIKGLDLTIESGELFFLLGPSGCGKTTALRTLAGFYDPEEGDVFFDDRRVNGTPANKRNTALVFQNYALWPHLTVFENVAYGLRVRNVPASDLQARVDTALSAVKMTPYAQRTPTQLSGGQQQRVALARAIVVNPELLLFDEPLSNLDARLRIEMRDEIKRLHAENRTTSLYVTHDQEEALTLAQRIGVMNEGVLEQIGTPREIYDRPATPFVASFIGEVNMLKPGSPLGQRLGQKAQHLLGFRPEKVHLTNSDNGIAATVKFSSYFGSKSEIDLEVGDSKEAIKMWTPDFLVPDSVVHITIDPEHLLHFTASA